VRTLEGEPFACSTIWQHKNLLSRSLQKNLDRGEPVIFTSYGIVGAILLLGGAGYFIDRWLDTLPWFSLAGVSVGLCVAF
jgi:F0F1-type ATP synthase assembly protein I